MFQKTRVKSRNNDLTSESDKIKPTFIKFCVVVVEIDTKSKLWRYFLDTPFYVDNLKISKE